MDNEAFYKICASILRNAFLTPDMSNDCIKVDGEIIDLFSGRSADRLNAKKKVFEILKNHEMIDLLVKDFVGEI